jgi:hypothetical protein
MLKARPSRQRPRHPGRLRTDSRLDHAKFGARTSREIAANSRNPAASVQESKGIGRLLPILLRSAWKTLAASRVGGVIIHDDANVEAGGSIMNDAAPPTAPRPQFADRLVVMTTVSNINMMTHTVRIGGCMLLMTLTTWTTSRRNASPLAGIRSQSPHAPRAQSSPRRRRIVKTSFRVSQPTSHNLARSWLWYGRGVKRNRKPRMARLPPMRAIDSPKNPRDRRHPWSDDSGSTRQNVVEWERPHHPYGIAVTPETERDDAWK